MHNAVRFCPVTSLRRFVNKESNDESQKLKGCFYFGTEVKPGWIQYDPEKITVLSCNESFRPMGQVSGIVNVHKQVLSVKNAANMRDLSDILEKPVLMCVTRRHECPNTAKTPSSDLESLERELTFMNGFDIDFAIIFPPGALREKIKESLEIMRKKITEGKKYCIMVDIRRMMQELTPAALQNKESLEFVSWHNTAFWLTNHCKPRHSLMYVNGFLFWVVLLPFSLFVALPYRLTRRVICKDTHVNLKTKLQFTAEAEDTVAVYVWFMERPPPGSYKKYAKQFSLRATKVTELKPFIQDCKLASFELSRADEI